MILVHLCQYGNVMLIGQFTQVGSILVTSHLKIMSINAGNFKTATINVFNVDVRLVDVIVVHIQLMDVIVV